MTDKAWQHKRVSAGGSDRCTSSSWMGCAKNSLAPARIPSSKTVESGMGAVKNISGAFASFSISRMTAKVSSGLSDKSMMTKFANSELCDSLKRMPSNYLRHFVSTDLHSPLLTEMSTRASLDERSDPPALTRLGCQALSVISSLLRCLISYLRPQMW